MTGPAWTADAACRNHPHIEWWFPDTGHHRDYSDARAICNGCPVRTECLAHAIAAGETEGMWGGQTPAERAGNPPKRRGRPPGPPRRIPCGSAYAYNAGCHCCACTTAKLSAKRKTK